jgi:outer membrane lipoprotein-sorting protein
MTMVSLGLVLGACSAEETATYSPDQIVANAVEKNNDLKGYYIKVDFEVYKGDELIDDSIMEQWLDNEKNRTKVISETADGEISMSLNDGEKAIFYSDMQGEAFEMEAPELNSEWTGQSQREQIEMTLEQTRETHDIELLGNEEINGFDTYHIKAVPKEENGLRGLEEYWVTTEHWIIVQSISESGDMKVNYKVTELDVNPSFNDDTFTLDLPEGVETKPFEEINPAEEVTLEEAAAVYGQPILTITDDAYELIKIEQFHMESFNRTEVSQEYQKDGYSQLILSSFETPEDEGLAMGFGKEEEIQVRGTRAVYTDEVITNLVWDEDGLRYSLLVQNPDLSKEEVIKIAENLEFVE